MSEQMTPIQKLREEHVFSDIDLEFCRFLEEVDPEINTEVLLAAGLTSYAYRQGNICISLDQESMEQIILDSNVKFPEQKDWVNKLAHAKVIGRPGEYKPLILDESNRLYLHKLWNYEQELAKNIIARSQKKSVDVDIKLLGSGIKRLFDLTEEEINWQAVAAIAAIYNNLTVISGGPGTGKTTTVLKILALILEQHEDSSYDLSIALCAPTGKAAARLEDSITSSIASLDTKEIIKEKIPLKGRTLHQLLGARRNSSTFRFNEDNPLPYDIVIVDEASMVDQALMSRLVNALLDDAKLILIGDKDQLASVEAGSVLGSICAMDTNKISPSFAKRLNKFGLDVPDNILENNPGKLTDGIILLEKSYRFKEESGIPSFSASINNGNVDEALSLLNDEQLAGISFQKFKSFEQFEENLKEDVRQYIIPLLQTADVNELFDKFQHFRLLSPHRRGPLGVEYLNQKVNSILLKEGLISKFDHWYHGKPIIVNQNEYSLGLNNGDIGICVRDGNDGYHVLFKSDSGFNSLAPSRLPDFSPAYALTVHKSQGSEFEHIKIILPEKSSGILTRELLYTAVTRSRSSVTVVGKETVLREMINAKIMRSSGLKELLWPDLD
ncbi:exodeoxyribonuclease V subunit alpha [Balneolaceae bacterium YR4-1]|uniref:Exodeoxyribonuclease V subunit alpha n=1 Tax=Halalkalibaculum roseum TaxID=2709311 RepID=A0A6M1SW30_9BACT|nr:exodeoxyribonuclease V subunit alpha [Halalkalibaculum roseum]NGP76348.1 exodeoxyribonuclease V subunit alpha [Halalkalibaculum roseum]